MAHHPIGFTSPETRLHQKSWLLSCSKPSYRIRALYPRYKRCEINSGSIWEKTCWIPLPKSTLIQHCCRHHIGCCENSKSNSGQWQKITFVSLTWSSCISVFVQKHRRTCDLDDSGNPVYFTRQDCICVQDLHLHPYSNVIPMLTHGDLQTCWYRSWVKHISLYMNATCYFFRLGAHVSKAGYWCSHGCFLL